MTCGSSPKVGSDVINVSKGTNWLIHNASKVQVGEGPSWLCYSIGSVHWHV